jgi:uncharacterized membrane protein YoaK (UPF0700 family)
MSLAAIPDPRAHLMANWLLPLLLSMTAGACDVISFLALGQLFNAHVTGNLVILAAHYVTGGYSQLGPLMSVPVFIAVAGLVTMAFRAPGRASNRSLRTLLVVHAALVASFLGLAVMFGPFPNADAAPAVFVGMLGVAAMATQNALVRLAMPGSPSTAVLTTNITQLTVDVASLAGGRVARDELASARRRVSALSVVVVGFLGGCAGGALLELRFSLWALLLPAALATAAVPLGELWSDSRARDQGSKRIAEAGALAGIDHNNSLPGSPDHQSLRGKE